MTTLTAADPTMGIAQFLRLDDVVNALTDGRIFRPDLEEGQDKEMPGTAIVVRPAGGGAMFGRGNLQVMDSRIDCICYGSTRLEGEALGREVARALKNMRAQRIGQGEPGGPLKLYWARISGGASSAIEPDALWPFALVSAQVMHSLNTLP
jgi:hypothetical protein